MSDDRDRIQYDGDRLDEVVLTDCLFHIERMSYHGWWMAAYRDGKRISFWFRMAGEPTVEQDCGPVPGVRVEQRQPLAYWCPHVWTTHGGFGEHQCEIERTHKEHRCECGARKAP